MGTISQKDKTLIVATMLRKQIEKLLASTKTTGKADMQLALAELKHLRLLIEQLPDEAEVGSEAQG